MSANKSFQHKVTKIDAYALLMTATRYIKQATKEEKYYYLAIVMPNWKFIPNEHKSKVIKQLNSDDCFDWLKYLPHVIGTRTRIYKRHILALHFTKQSDLCNLFILALKGIHIDIGMKQRLVNAYDKHYYKLTNTCHLKTIHIIKQYKKDILKHEKKHQTPEYYGSNIPRAASYGSSRKNKRYQVWGHSRQDYY